MVVCFSLFALVCGYTCIHAKLHVMIERGLGRSRNSHVHKPKNVISMKLMHQSSTSSLCAISRGQIECCACFGRQVREAQGRNATDSCATLAFAVIEKASKAVPSSHMGLMMNKDVLIFVTDALYGRI